jgi:hypothetical protein
MSIDPTAVWLGAGALPPTAFVASEPLTAGLVGLVVLLAAAAAGLWWSQRTAAPQRRPLQLRLVRP